MLYVKYIQQQQKEERQKETFIIAVAGAPIYFFVHN